MNALQDRIKALAKTYFNDTVLLRRHLHEYPELSQEEYNTMAFVSKELSKLNIPHKTGIGKTGILGIIEGKNPDKSCIALRADYDALPMEENTGLPFASKNKGIMHACGHDMHTASLLGAARILNELKDEFEGRILLIFQPSEEKYPGGAYLMMQDGIFNEYKPDSIYAFHCLPEMEYGKVGMKSGKYMASTDEIYLTVKGKGGHGGTPDLNIDPVVIASHIVVALQQIVSRNASPMMPTILSIGKMIANGRTNIIPDEVKMEGTIRTFSNEWRTDAHQHIEKISKGVAQSMGGDCEVFIDKGYPFLVNDEQITQMVKDNAVSYLGNENVVDLEMRMTAEDFAFFAQEIPACYFRVGTRKPNTEITNLHTVKFDIDERSIELAMGFMAFNALRGLAR
ncbi:M20 family metallopeptidase [Bacteroidales bacterium OttesenSCG-928-C19]|nr:M20 family metallopeptidase [Bacteroidales bacterium OttesenSCG-928-C19]